MPSMSLKKINFKMKRRDLLKKVGFGVGALAVSPFTISLLQSCNKDFSWNPIFFKKGDIEFLNELSDLIIPSSAKIPGSKELNLLRFVDIYISKVLSKGEQKTIYNALDKFKLEYLKSSSLSNIDSKTLNSLLDYFFVKNKPKHDIWMNDFMSTEESQSYIFLYSLRELLISAFKTNEYIGKNILVYRPIPGEQRGCVDLIEATNGRAWTI
jgi:hypothetical protein